MAKHITVALTEDQEAHFRAQAEIQEITIEALVAEVIQQRLDHDAWFAKEVQKGIDQIERGEWIDHDEFVARRRRMREELTARARPR